MDSLGNITLYNDDCLRVMASFPDKSFDLAIVDPPYGMDAGHAHGRLKKYGQLVTANEWKPTPEYFKELFRVSKNQVIWGYNHLSDMLPSCSEFLFWYKHNATKSFSDGELAWTSYTKTAHCIDLPYFGTVNADERRVHPTQKPVKLYAWILNQYAKPGMRILDTFGGAMSSMIACYRGGYEATCIEIDKTYYEKGKARLVEEMSLGCLFAPEDLKQPTTASLFV